MADSWEDAADVPPPAGQHAHGGGFVPRAEAPSFVPRANAPTFVPGQAFNYAAPPPPPPRAQPPPPARPAPSQQQQQPQPQPQPAPPAAPPQPPSSSSAPGQPPGAQQPPAAAAAAAAASTNGDVSALAAKAEALSVADQPAASTAMEMDGEGGSSGGGGGAGSEPSSAPASAAAAAVEDVPSVDEGRVMEAYKRLMAEDPRDHLNVVFIGHVDAGKSTLGGQILFITGVRGCDARARACVCVCEDRAALCGRWWPQQGCAQCCGRVARRSTPAPKRAACTRALCPAAHAPRRRRGQAHD
jgi:peptide chain release factor subunit 3